MKNWKKYLKVIFYIILFIGLVFLSILIEEKEHILKYFNNIDKISNVFTNFIIGIIITYVISQIIKYKKYFSLLWATQKLSIIIVILLSIGILYSPCIKNNELTKLLGSIIAIVIGLFIYRAQRRILPWDVLKRLNCEFKEITRHLERNFEVLESIQTTKGIPSLIHIKKLKIDDHTTLTDSDILKNIPSSLTSKIYPMTIRIRNYNITFQCLERAIKFKNATLFDKYLQEIKIITKVLQKDIYNYIIEIQEKLPKIEN